MRCKLLGCALLVVAWLGEGRVRADDKGVFGLGLIVGEPTGVSGKYYLGDDTAIDGAAGGAVIGRGIQVHGDFLWHPWMLEQKEAFALPAYIGLGLRILDKDNGDAKSEWRIGLRVPVGIVFDFTSVPLDVFVEIAGVLDYRTKGDPLGLDINAGAGVRYYF